MKMNELETYLIYHKVPRQWYCLKGTADDAYGIMWEKGKWIVYVEERGGKNPLEVFDREDDACQYLGEFLVRKLERAKKAQERRKKSETSCR